MSDSRHDIMQPENNINENRTPIGAIAAFILVAIIAIAIATVPPLYKARMEAMQPQKVMAAWESVTYQGRCYINAQLINPASKNGKRIDEVAGDKYMAVLITFDNSKGIRPLTMDTASARFYDYSGRSINSLNLRPTVDEEGNPVKDRAPEITVKPGDIHRDLIFFPREKLAGKLDRLYALQLSIDGETYNLEGTRQLVEDKAS